MRDIKFRAWDNQFGCMRYMDTGIDFVFETNDGFKLKGKYWDGCEVSDCILIQYTGLKDKNGKEIYEGDIVTFQTIKGVVEYTEDCAFEVMRKVGDKGTGTIEEGEPLSTQYEIIGNIHENKDLLNNNPKRKDKE